MTVAGSISTPSLSGDFQPSKLSSFPPTGEVSQVFLPTYPHVSTASTSSWCDLRNPLQAHLGYYEESVTMQDCSCLGHPAFTTDGDTTCSRSPVRPFSSRWEVRQKGWIEQQTWDTTLPSGSPLLTLFRWRRHR